MNSSIESIIKKYKSTHIKCDKHRVQNKDQLCTLKKKSIEDIKTKQIKKILKNLEGELGIC